MDRYSRFVAWLKVLLPLMALMLLSTLFLLSRNIDPIAEIPFAKNEIQERLRNEQITGPVFSGTTDSGDRVIISAQAMKMGKKHNNEGNDIWAQIDLSSGNRVVLSSEKGIFDMLEQRSTLQGNVVIATSTGYEITTEALTANFQTLALESPGSVAAIGPIGTFNAGKMRLVRRNNKENAHLLFTNGVRLVYRPRHTKE